MIRGSSGFSPASFFQIFNRDGQSKFLVVIWWDRTPHNLSLPISDSPPPLNAIAINAKSAKPSDNFWTLPRWNRISGNIKTSEIPFVVI